MRMQGRWTSVLAFLCSLPLLFWFLVPPPALAGPVSWNEVPPTPEGRQWWDAGSLRLSRNGALTVLSRFQPSGPGDQSEANNTPGRPAPSTLYVMELDCSQELFRDISINGFPQFRAEWQTAAGDDLSTEVLRAACRAGGPLLPNSPIRETS